MASHSVTVRRKGDSQIVLVGYHIPAGRSADAAALSALSDILGETPSGRLHHELVETGLAAQVFAEPMFLHDPGVIIFGRDREAGRLGRARGANRLIDVVEHSLGQTGADPGRDGPDCAGPRKPRPRRALADPQGFGVVLSDYNRPGPTGGCSSCFRDGHRARRPAPQLVAALAALPAPADKPHGRHLPAGGRAAARPRSRPRWRWIRC